MRKKAGMAFAAFIGLVVLSAVFILFWNFNSPELGRQILTRAGEITGVELSAERFRFNVLRGMVLENVQAQGPIIAGGRYVLRLKKVICVHRWTSLFRGTVAIERILLEGGQLEIALGRQETRTSPALPYFGPPVTGPGARKKEEIETETDNRLQWEIGKIILSDGALTVRDAGKETPETMMILSGLRFTFRNLSYDPARAITPLHSLTAEGEVQVDETTMKGRRVREVASYVQLEGGRMRWQGLRLRTDRGAFKGEIDVNLNANVPVYELTLDADPFNLNAMAGTESGFGPAHLHLSGKGVGFDGKYLAGNGLLKLEKGKLPNYPALIRMEEFLGRHGLVHSPYKPTVVPFVLDRGQITLQDISIETERAILSVSGRAGIDGSVELEITVQMPREEMGIRNIPPEQLDGWTSREGWVTVPLKIAGTLENPELSLRD